MAPLHPLLPALLLLPACASGGKDDTGVPAVGIEVEASIPEDAPLSAVVAWRTPGVASTGRVELRVGDEVIWSAPDAVAGESHTAALWGLLPDAEATVVVHAEADGAEVESDPITVTTQPLPSGVPAVTAELGSGAPPEGFFLTTILAPPGTDGLRPAAALFDVEGNYRWLRLLPADTVQTCARLVPTKGEVVTAFETLYQLGIDGVIAGESGDGPSGHHDLAVEDDGSLVTLRRVVYPLPDGKEGFVDDVVRVDPDGGVAMLWDGTTAADEMGWADGYGGVPGYDITHANAVAWDEAHGVYLVDLSSIPAVVAIDPATGETTRVIEGSSVLIDGVSHPVLTHQILPVEGGFLWFVNENDHDACSGVIRVPWDDPGAATWLVRPDACDTVFALGDILRPASGGTVVGWSTQGRVQHFDDAGDVTWTLSTEFGYGFGYGEWLSDLSADP